MRIFPAINPNSPWFLNQFFAHTATTRSYVDEYKFLLYSLNLYVVPWLIKGEGLLTTRIHSTIMHGPLKWIPLFRFSLYYHCTKWTNEESDPRRYGEDGIYDGCATGVTNSSGDIDFTVYFDPPLEWGFSVSATATDTAGYTAEFPPVVFIGELVDLGGYLTPALNLEWLILPPAAEYWIFGEENNHYFEPELVPSYGNQKDIVPGSNRNWSSNEGIGDIDWNMTYLVISIRDYGQIISRSNRFGEFDFNSNRFTRISHPC